MKRTITLLLGIVIVTLLATVSALMQSQSQPSPSDLYNHLGIIAPVAEPYLSQSRQHKLLFQTGGSAAEAELAVYEELKRSGGILQEVDYGSFKMVVVDEYFIGGRDALLRLGNRVRDDFNLISLGGHDLDTTAPEATLNQLPMELRQSDMAQALARGGAPRGGLYLAQFIGPVQDKWLTALEQTGAELVSYVGANAYLVSASPRSAMKLLRLKQKKSFLQFLGDYEPAFRLSPYLQAIRTRTDLPTVAIKVQLLQGAETATAEALLQSWATEPLLSYPNLKHRIVAMSVAPSRLTEMARLGAVLTVREAVSSSATPSGNIGAVAKRGDLTVDVRDTQPSLAMHRARQAVSMESETMADSLALSGQAEGYELDQTQILTATGQTHRLAGRITDSVKPTRIALAWNSPRTAVGATPLVNDLDLEVAINGAIYKGNVFSDNASISGGAADHRNSLEAIILPAGLAGEFTLTVRAANLTADGAPEQAGRTDQDFALVVVNAAICPSVSIFPTNFNLFAVEGVSVFATNSISLSSNPSNIPFTAARGLFSSWIDVLPCAFCQTPDSVRFRAPYPFGLSRGFYSGSVEIRVGDCTFPNTVHVNLDVAPPSLFLSPASLSFTAPAGGPNPANQSFIVSTNTTAMSWSLTSNASWLSASPTSGTAASSSSVSVGVNVAGLAPGTYTGTITVTAPSAGNSPRTLTVTLNVATPQIGVNPTSLTFTTGTTGANPPAKTISITNTGIGTLNWTATDNRPWITVSPTSGTAPSSLSVAINKTGLAVGTYTGTVTISAPGASNSPVNIPITLVISNTPIISVTPTSLIFISRNGALPAPKTLSLSNGGGGTLNWNASSNVSWLSVSPTSGTAPSTLTVSVDPFGLDIGTYSGAITLTAAGASPVTVPVTLTIFERIRPPIEP